MMERFLGNVEGIRLNTVEYQSVGRRKTETDAEMDMENEKMGRDGEIFV